MARVESRPRALVEKALHACTRRCPGCREDMWSAYTNCRTVTTLGGLQGIRLHIRRCRKPSCSRYHLPFRPEEEGRIALPQHGFGLDVIGLVGALRYQQHRSVPEIHQELAARRVGICERSVTNLLDRYDELASLRLADSRRLQKILSKQGRVILALDGLQPDVRHEVLWVLRDCLSGEVLLARSLLVQPGGRLGQPDRRGEVGGSPEWPAKPDTEGARKGIGQSNRDVRHSGGRYETR
jgi:hypothetical protein